MGILLGALEPEDEGNIILQKSHTIHKMTDHNIPEDLNLQQHYHGNFNTTSLPFFIEYNLSYGIYITVCNILS